MTKLKTKIVEFLRKIEYEVEDSVLSPVWLRAGHENREWRRARKRDDKLRRRNCAERRKERKVCAKLRKTSRLQRQQQTT